MTYTDKKLTDEEHNRLHPIRPKYGFELAAGWGVAGSDEACTSCGQPAATLTLDGERMHPMCHEIKQKKTTTTEGA